MARPQDRFLCHAYDNVRGGHCGEREGLYPSSSIYVNSEQCWQLFYRRGTIRLGSRWKKYRLNQMAKLEMSVPGLAVRKSTAQHIMGQASVALVYLGIVAAFALV